MKYLLIFTVLVSTLTGCANTRTEKKVDETIATSFVCKVRSTTLDDSLLTPVKVLLDKANYYTYLSCELINYPISNLFVKSANKNSTNFKVEFITENGTLVNLTKFPPLIGDSYVNINFPLIDNGILEVKLSAEVLHE